MCVCVYFMCVFMAAARSPAGRVLGPIERVTTPAASEETSSAPLWRKPEWTGGEKQINHRNGEQRTSTEPEFIKLLKVRNWTGQIIH